MDNDLRTLEREIALAPEDESLKFRYRSELVRSGQAQKAKPIRKGDIVAVSETENPWINGTWEGEVIEVLKDGDMNVKPISPEGLDYRVKPSAEYMATGLYIMTKDADNSVIVRPVST